MSVFKELLDQLYFGYSPFDYVNVNDTDFGYPHTNIDEPLINAVMTEFKPTFWLEIGSMLGNSAIKVAKANPDVEIVCLDPFCGDVNMWAWERNLFIKKEWRFLNLIKGQPTIYNRFLANVKSSGYETRIMPIPCTSIIGLKLLARLHDERRITQLPSVIYLDSAHEEDETYLEIKRCWELLPSGGLLIGDDWDWAAVRNDALRFFINKTVNLETKERLTSVIAPTEDLVNIVRYNNQWVAFK